MNGQSLGRSAALVAYLLGLIAAGALGLVACSDSETGASASPSAVTSSAPPSATSPEATPAQTNAGTLVVTHISEADNYDLYLVRGDGTGLRQLTADPANEQYAYWSPDGTRIVYCIVPIEGSDDWNHARVRIWVMNADGSGKVRLGLGAWPSWSPDGKQILYQRRFDSYELSVMNADGSGRRVVGVPFTVDYATWAPNGKIVFVGVRQPRDQWWSHPGGDLYAVNPDGSGLQRLTQGTEMTLPSVSPDGATIAAYATKTDRLIAVPYRGDGPAVTLLARASHYFPNGGMPLAHWAPDGKRLVLGSSNRGEDGGAGLLLVNADGSGLTNIPGVTQVIGPDWQPE